jgi:hypothetical protein
MLPAIVALIAHENCVVHSYAAHCMERLLMIKDAGVPRFGPPDISPALTQLLTNLFGAWPFLPVVLPVIGPVLEWPFVAPASSVSSRGVAPPQARSRWATRQRTST